MAIFTVIINQSKAGLTTLIYNGRVIVSASTSFASDAAIWLKANAGAVNTDSILFQRVATTVGPASTSNVGPMQVHAGTVAQHLNSTLRDYGRSGAGL